MRGPVAATAVAALVGTFLVFDVASLPVLPQPLDAAGVPAKQTVVPLSGALASVSGGVLQSDVVEADDFSVVGVTWSPDDAPEGVGVEARVRESDGWSAWTVLDLVDSGPDPDTEEARLAADVVATEPLTTGSADAVQVRLTTADGAVPDGLEVVLIDPGEPGATGTGATTAPLTAALSAAGASAGQPAIVTRGQWGADESKRRCSPIYSSTVLAATVHHTAGTNSYTQAESAGIVRGIYAYHTGTLGWCDVGYNLLVDKYGTVFEGRYGGLTRAVRGAHASGFNDRTVGVSALGNYETAAAPAAMVRAMGEVAGWTLSLFGRSATGTVTLTSAGGGTAKYAAGTSVSLPAVFAHRDVGRTACPGVNLYAAMGSLRTAAAERAAVATAPVSSPSPTTASTTASPTPTSLTAAPTTSAPTTAAPTTAAPTTAAPTTSAPTTAAPTTAAPTTPAPTTPAPTTAAPTTSASAPTSATTLDLRGAVVVPVDLDRAGAQLLTYRNATPGSRHVTDVSSTGVVKAVHSGVWTLGWDSVVPVEIDGTKGQEVLLYNRRSGRVVVVDTTRSGTTPMLLDRKWAAGWTHVVPVEVDGRAGSELLLYNATTGAQRVVKLSAAGTTREISRTTWSTGWTHLSAAEVDRTARSELSAYNAASGRHVFLELGDGTRSARIAEHTLPKGLSAVTPLEVDRTAGSELLTYHPGTGATVVRDISSTGRLSTLRSHTWTKGWSSAVVVEADGTAGSELVVHNRTTGRLLVLGLDTSGGARQLG